MKRLLKLTIVGLAVVAGGAEVRGGEVRYVLTDLAALSEGGTAWAHDINEWGEVVGTSGNAFLYDGTEMLDIGKLSSAGSATAMAINDWGEVVGWATGGGMRSNVFYYDGLRMHDLGALGGVAAEPYDINNEGQIVGYIGGDKHYGYVLQGDDLTTFESLVPGESFAEAINDAGQVVGSAVFDHGHFRAFLYQGEDLIDLGTLGGNTSTASAINESGQIAGRADLADGRRHASLWEGAAIIDLGTLGGESSFARAINDPGVIVGDSYTSSGQRHMFLWDGSTMLDVNELILNADGWDIAVPAAINNAGQIVGTATFLGESRGYLLTPTEVVAEPSAIALFAAGCVTWWAARRGRRRNLTTE